MSDTPRTDVAEHNMGSVVEPHYVVDVEVAQGLERELAEVKEQLRLCNVDQWTTAAELADARKDAERYRWLRDNKKGKAIATAALWAKHPYTDDERAKGVDATIDAAIKELK